MQQLHVPRLYSRRDWLRGASGMGSLALTYLLTQDGWMSQALVLLNSKQVLESAQSFAGEVLEKAGADRKAQVDLAYRLAYSRTPDASERDTALSFLSTHQPILEARVAQNQPIPLPGKLPAGVEKLEAAALVDLCHMLLNSNEFVYVN